MNRGHVEPWQAANRREIEDLIVWMAKENRPWGYDQIVGASRGNGVNSSGLPRAPNRTAKGLSIHSRQALCLSSDGSLGHLVGYVVRLPDRERHDRQSRIGRRAGAELASIGDE